MDRCGLDIRLSPQDIDQPMVSFSEGLSLLSQTRQSTLMNGFMDALTRGGPGGLPRPIELHAHDPMRYVGAWVNQAIAAERESSWSRGLV